MIKNSKSTLIFIVGPTAVGKTRLSVKLARRINGEIISSDSMQVYRGMKILSQAPSQSLMKKVKHYLIGTLSPTKEYNVNIFRKKASRLIDSIIKKKKIPIVVGGSGLYVKALIDGLFPAPEADLKFRRRMLSFVRRYGNEKLHKKLSKIDPGAAKKIHPNDTRRIIRALEVYNSTGQTMTGIKSQTKGLKDKYNIMIFGLTRPRERIYSDIDLRVENMFKRGLLEEVKRLKKKRLSRTARAVLGFKEIMGYLKGSYDLNRALELLKRNTRHFAKRQLAWFRADSRIRWFDLDRSGDEGIIKDILKEIE